MASTIRHTSSPFYLPSDLPQAWEELEKAAGKPVKKALLQWSLGRKTWRTVTWGDRATLQRLVPHPKDKITTGHWRLAA